MSAISRDRSSKSTSARSSKSSKKVVFAGRADSTQGGSDYARDDSVMDMVDTEPLDRPETVGDELELMDLPPAPTTAHSDTLYSSLTIYTPGDQIVNIHKMGGIKRGSCEWTNTNVPCINKIASHLSNLQRQLDAPKIEKKITDSSRLGSLIGPTPGEPLLKVTNYDSSYSKGLELIEEVKTLMNRLESDRQQTITVYQREVERVKLLQLQVDQVERKRLYILPKAVQLEHEACSQDISELKWDLENWKEERREIEAKVKTAVEENKNLQSEIKKLEEQCPRIGEKLDIDKHTLEDISDDLRESKMALDYTMEGLRKVTLKYEKADGRAETERLQLRSELANIRKTLTGVQTELSEAQEINATHNADITELNRAIHQAEQEGADLDNDIERAKEEERQAQARVNCAKVDLLEIAENIKAKRRANSRLTQQMADKFNFVKTELDNRDRKQQRTLRFDKSMLREALQTAVRMEREIIDFKKELTVSIKKARDDEKATSRAQAELKHLDQQLHVVVEEVQKLAEQNARLSLDAHRTEEDIVNTETALKNNLTMLRKTLQDEIQAKTSLSNKMMSEQEDFDKYQNDSSRKLARTEKKKDDLEEVHTKYTEEKDSLTVSLNAIHKERDELNASIASTQSILAAEKAQLEKQIETLKPEEKEVREEMEGTQKAIDDLQWRCNMVSKKIQETLDASKVVMKIQKQTEDNIADLTLKIENLEAELVDGQEHEKSLQENLNHIKDNQLLSRNQYKSSLDKRLKIFRELKETVEEEIEINVKTSEKYNTLQAKHDQVKNDYQRALHIKLDLEMSVDDVSNVMRLQKRMHKALISYYMHRGYHNRIVLTDFGKGASMNLLQLEKVHRNLCEVINKTEGYLDKHGSGVARKQLRVPTPELRQAEGDLNRLPILIETPPVPKVERTDTASSISDGRATGQGESMVTMD